MIFRKLPAVKYFCVIFSDYIAILQCGVGVIVGDICNKFSYIFFKQKNHLFRERIQWLHKKTLGLGSSNIVKAKRKQISGERK